MSVALACRENAAPESRVSSWADLQEQLFADAWQPELQRHRSSFAFRGRNNGAEDLRPSLLRLGGDWTYSPLVALHFATARLEHYAPDGVVWTVARSRPNCPQGIGEIPVVTVPGIM